MDTAMPPVCCAKFPTCGKFILATPSVRAKILATRLRPSGIADHIIKTAKHLPIIASLFLASSLYVSGIEGLKLTIRCPDVVLSWPSIEGENYIVQFRETLSTNTPWGTLTNYLPAEWGTNTTTFTHSNRVECPPEEILGRTTTEKTPPFQPDYPLVVPSDGSRAPVPLGLYPPGIDLTGYAILWPDGSTDEWSAKLAEGWRVIQQAQRNGLEPQGIEDDSEPDIGFYQVVRDGVRIWGVTNIASPLVLSGMVDIPFEAGNADPYSTNLIGTLNCAVLLLMASNFVAAQLWMLPLLIRGILQWTPRFWKTATIPFKSRFSGSMRMAQTTGRKAFFRAG